MKLVCQTCRWWNYQPKTQFGQCHRYPPTVLAEGDSHPVTKPNDWCGEWSHRAISQINERAKASEDPTTAEG